MASIWRCSRICASCSGWPPRLSHLPDVCLIWAGQRKGENVHLPQRISKAIRIRCEASLLSGRQVFNHRVSIGEPPRGMHLCGMHSRAGAVLLQLFTRNERTEICKKAANPEHTHKNCFLDAFQSLHDFSALYTSETIKPLTARHAHWRRGNASTSAA